MKKKFITLLVCIIIATSLISCNDSNETADSPSFAQKQVTTEASTTKATLQATTSTTTLAQTEATTTVSTKPETENTSEASNEIITTETSVQQPVEQMVWISATGSKYHNKPDCGKMNPDVSRQMSKSDAEAQGYEACKKCY
ncbi:hypothetical protein LQE92_09025 [Lacrimispora sp. NSJ-141]|uniref:Uncharacterized protein n=1 Tax=Lientehia hominis TaxID=2897778 RepID=A0AAP2RJH8_9FIRM|nr:hypothetical protein [Lientehia hominis]MCD2492770.1 hypothetical protein [Lientehia hominis]